MNRPNYIYLRGNLGRDPTRRENSPLLEVATCTIATHCRHGTGADVVHFTQWHDVVAYAEMAPVLLQFRRGQYVEIEGHASYRLRNGKPTRVLTVVVDRIRLAGRSNDERSAAVGAPST